MSICQNQVFTPTIQLSPPPRARKNERHPFKFIRKQFPIHTTNKFDYQGQIISSLINHISSLKNLCDEK